MQKKKVLAIVGICAIAVLVDLYVILKGGPQICGHEYSTKLLIVDIVLCLAADAAAFLCIKNLKQITDVFIDIFRGGRMFFSLVKNDFKAKFAGSFLGIIWAFIQPFITMVLYWFVFQVGLRAGKVSEYPFILFLMSGLIPWFYFSEAFAGATNSLNEYNYLVKKVVFNVEMLPVIKVISAIFVHIFFTVFIMIICSLYGYWPDLYCLQLIYYIIAMVILVLGLGYITSACTAFFKDVAQIVNIILTVGVWITPIMWNPVGMLSDTLVKVFKLNPFYYIVDGFRDALLAKTWFWDKPEWTIYFWVFTIVIYILGIRIFKKLKPHFSDVL